MNIFQTFKNIRDNKIFEALVISVILISAISVGFRTFDESINPGYFLWLGYIDYLITVVFLIEIIVRIIAEKNILKFFKQGWNIFDFCIVTISLIPIDNSETVFLARLVRIFRLMRLISFVPQFRILIEALIKAIPRVGYVLLLMFIVFYIYAALGSLMFGELDHLHWGNIALAMLTLFQTATLEGWPDLLYSTLEVYPWSWLFFVSFIIINSFIFLNMIIGVIIDIVIRSNNDNSPEEIKLLEEINSKLDELSNNKSQGRF